eukprot:7053685-Pyramimonas_sp.AAC.1
MPTYEGSSFGAAVRPRSPSDSFRSVRPRTESPTRGLERDRGEADPPPPSSGLGSPSLPRP